MKSNIINSLISIIVGIILFFVTGYASFWVTGLLKLNTSYVGVPLNILSSCFADNGIYCTASPIFNWLNIFLDLLFWSVMSYMVIKLIRSKK